MQAPNWAAVTHQARVVAALFWSAPFSPSQSEVLLRSSASWACAALRHVDLRMIVCSSTRDAGSWAAMASNVRRVMRHALPSASITAVKLRQGAGCEVCWLLGWDVAQAEATHKHAHQGERWHQVRHTNSQGRHRVALHELSGALRRMQCKA